MSMQGALPKMNSILDVTRCLLEQSLPELGVTDPISETVVC